MKIQDKNSIKNSLIWKFLERGGTQGIQFIVQIFLARLLLPNDYGIIAIVTIFTSIANIFVQQGFNTALIQKKEIDEVDLSTVFYINIIVAFFIYILFFFFSPSIANYYGMSQLKNVLRVISLILFLGAFNSIQNAIISREMKFKVLFYSSLISVVVSGPLGIITAYLGGGVWALVVQQISYQFTVTLVLAHKIRWRPTIKFSINKARALFQFGWKILLTSLIDTLYTDLRTLLIGRIYLPKVLGFYNRGKQFPALVITNINGAIQSVMLPALSSQQDNKYMVKNMMRKSIVISSFIVFPMLTGLFVVSENLIVLLLTEKWIEAVPFLQIYCISYALFPIHTSNLQAINAIGRSDIFLKLEVLKKIVGVSVLLFSLKYGVYGIAIGEVFVGLISSVINAYPNKKILHYGYVEQVKDIMPAFIISIVMGVIVYSTNYIKGPIFFILVIQVIIGAISYYLLARVFKLESLSYLEINIIGKKRHS